MPILHLNPLHGLALRMMKMYLWLLRQRLMNLIDTLIHPGACAERAERVQELVVGAEQEVVGGGGALGHNDVDVLADGFAEGVEGEVVDVAAKGVFDFAADEAAGCVSVCSGGVCVLPLDLVFRSWRGV
jgi:hypothetical protein